MVIPASGAKAGTVTAYQFYNAVMYSHARTTQHLGRVTARRAGRACHALIMRRRCSTCTSFTSCWRRAARNAAPSISTRSRPRSSATSWAALSRSPSVRNDAHKLIEECMLAANTCAADFMTRSKHPGLYRIHEGPTPELSRCASSCAPWACRRWRGETPTAKDYGDFLDSVRGRPDYQLLQTMCLRSMQQAIYSPDNLGHFGRPIPATATSRRRSAAIRPADASRHQGAVGRPALCAQPGRPRGGHRPHTARARARHLGKTGPDAVGRERRADEASRDVEAWLRAGSSRSAWARTSAARSRAWPASASSSRWIRCTSKGWCMCRNWAASTSSSTMRCTSCGERTGMRYRLTDKVQVQVSRVDLEARHRVPPGPGHQLRRLAQGGGARSDDGSRRVKKAAAPAGGPEGPDRQGAPRRGQEGAAARGGEKPKR